jgi:hypothetical protein
MSDLKAVFDSLYTNLLLRDLGAKVAPGMAVLVAVRMGMTNVAQTIKDMNEAHLGAWLVATAIAWLAGLGSGTRRADRKAAVFACSVLP